MSSLGFKVDPLACELCCLRFTSGATPADLLAASMAAVRFDSYHVLEKGLPSDVILNFLKYLIEVDFGNCQKLSLNRTSDGTGV